MMWNSLKALRLATKLEFVPALEKKHSFVLLENGRWTRVLGVPDRKLCKRTGDRTWTMVSR